MIDFNKSTDFSKRAADLVNSIKSTMEDMNVLASTDPDSEKAIENNFSLSGTYSERKSEFTTRAQLFISRLDDKFVEYEKLYDAIKEGKLSKTTVSQIEDALRRAVLAIPTNIAHASEKTKWITSFIIATRSDGLDLFAQEKYKDHFEKLVKRLELDDGFSYLSVQETTHRPEVSHKASKEREHHYM